MNRVTQRETLLIKLRRDPRLYGDNHKAIQIQRLIGIAKRLSTPVWKEKSDRHNTERLNRWFAIQ